LAVAIKQHNGDVLPEN